MAQRGFQGFVGLLVLGLAVASCSGSAGTGTTGGPDGSTGGPDGSTHLDGHAGSTVDGHATSKDGAGGGDSGGPGCTSGCATGATCTAAPDCASGVCTSGTCAAPSPTDGVKNDSETDVDCGGAILASGATNPASDSAPACADGKSCTLGSDCTSDSCQGGVCVPPTCTDMIEDGNETDVDCGGGTCAACPTGDTCAVATDCASDVCTNHACIAPTDTDGIKNDSETDVDCGGGLLASGSANPASDGAPVCATGKTCAIGSDCAQGVCSVNPPATDDAGVSDASKPEAATTDGGAAALVCQPARPSDGVKNDSETDVDCGGALLASGATNPASDGAPACGSGKACVLTTDCVSLVCTGNVCQAPSATDGVKNDSETDIDCGGGLLASGAANPASDGALTCVDGKDCVLGTDCEDLVCATGPVTTPSANGSPINCPAGSTCTCQAPTPKDGVANDSETDVDCGGALLATGSANLKSDGAPVCAVTKKCALGTDCAQGVCNSTMGAGAGPASCPTGDACVCQAASSRDGVKNDSETDVDCGGALLASGSANTASDGATTCAVGKACSLGTDCITGVCNGNTGKGPFTAPIALNCPVGSSCTCQAAAPNDGVKNDSESAIDCGGAFLATGAANTASDGAPACADSDSCVLATDCLSGYCSAISHTCVAGQSCVGLSASASIMDVTTLGNGSVDAVGKPDPNGVGQHAGIDTCGKGESTDATGQAHDSCCTSLVIPPSVLPTGVAAGTRLDKYEVTSGRVRQFIETVSAQEFPKTGNYYDLQAWMLAQFDATTTTPVTPIGTLFAAQIPSTTTPKAIIALMPSNWFGDFNIVAELGGTTLDPFHPSASQGCYVSDDANGAATYWWTAKTNDTVVPPVIGGDVVGAAGRPYTQDYYDIKSMNCAPYWIYAAFCAWDGGEVATLAETDGVYGKQQYPWDTAGVNTFLPADYTYTTVTTGTTPHYYQNFVPGTNYYTGNIAAGTPGYNAVDLTVNWNNDSFGGNPGDFYYYPNGGGGPTDPPASVLATGAIPGLDYSPFIAAPGRFYLDKTAILSPSGPGTEGWQDLGANMLEMQNTLSGTATSVFCDCSSGGQATAATACPTACPNTTPKMYPIVRNGGVGLPEISWEGGSWEGHTAANPEAATYFSKGGYTEPLQTQYGKAGFRCVRAPEP